MTTNFRGILFCLAAGFFLTWNDAASKLLVSNYPPGQILFYTCLIVASVIFLLSRCSARIDLGVRSWKAHLVRGLLFSVSAFGFITALKYLPLANAMCIAFAAPLFVTFLGRVVLNEPVGPYRLAAVFIGFAGVIIMIRPGATAFQWYLMLPLMVAIADACRDILTRKMTLTESSISMVFTTALTIAAVSLTTLLTGWKPFIMEHLWLIFTKSSLMLVAYFLLIEAYRNAPAVVIAPFRYLQIAWGMLIGLLLWQDLPTINIFVGLTLTVGSGVFIALREARIQPLPLVK